MGFFVLVKSAFRPYEHDNLSGAFSFQDFEQRHGFSIRGEQESRPVSLVASEEIFELNGRFYCRALHATALFGRGLHNCFPSFLLFRGPPGYAAAQKWDEPEYPQFGSVPQDFTERTRSNTSERQGHLKTVGRIFLSCTI